MEAGPAPSIVQPKSSAAAARVEESDKAAYLVEYARSGRAKCKGRKPCNGSLIANGTLRLGVLVTYGEHGDGYQFRHWGCVTNAQLLNMSAQYAAADEIGGFKDLELEDKVRITNAFQNGQIDLVDMSEKAPPRKGGPLPRTEPEQPQETDLGGANVNGEDEYAYAEPSTETTERAPNPSRKSRGKKLPNYGESGDDLEGDSEPESVDVKSKGKRAWKQPAAGSEADEDVKPSLKRVKSENVEPLSEQAKPTKGGGRRVKKEVKEPPALASDVEMPVVKVKKQRKLKEIQPGPTTDAQGYPVRRSGRHGPSAEAK